MVQEFWKVSQLAYFDKMYKTTNSHLLKYINQKSRVIHKMSPIRNLLEKLQMKNLTLYLKNLEKEK